MKKVLMFTLIMMMVMSSCVFAAGTGGGKFAQQNLSKGDLGSMQGKALTLLGTLQWVGYLVAIGMIIWVGIKYLTSGAGEKAKAKETLVPIVIGAVLVAGATWVATSLFTALG